MHLARNYCAKMMLAKPKLQALRLARKTKVSAPPPAPGAQVSETHDMGSKRTAKQAMLMGGGRGSEDQTPPKKLASWEEA